MQNHYFRTILGLLCCAALPLGAFAQSASLYGDAAPEDAAFVRIYNTLTETQNIWVGSAQFSGIEHTQSTVYRTVNPGVHAVFAGNEFAELVARDGAYYTVVLAGEDPVVYEDSRHTRADQSQIILYNIGFESDVELRTADGGTVVIPAVPAGESDSVSVNPVAIELAVFMIDDPAADEPTPVAELGNIGLERGQSFAVFAGQYAGDPAVRVQQAEVLLQ